MGKWNYKLDSGKALREAIDNDDSENTLNCLRKCYEEIHKLIPDIYDEDDLADDISEINNQLDNLANYEEYNMTEEDCQDEINDLLSDFYDFCDDNRIWIGLKI